VWRVCTQDMWSVTTRPAPRPGALVLVASVVLFDTKGMYSLTLAWDGSTAEVVAGPVDMVFVSGHED